jgi:transcriptional regulator with XRE-family HTH domain|tara:strand:+ start:262 stop:537 length:276 start_codon:yes stop_codon:yes gene_type:complete
MESTTYKETMGNRRLRGRRKDLRYSQRMIAERVGVTQPDISRMEFHNWLPPRSVQQRIADLLETTVSDLFDDDGGVGINDGGGSSEHPDAA